MAGNYYELLDRWEGRSPDYGYAALSDLSRDTQEILSDFPNDETGRAMEIPPTHPRLRRQRGEEHHVLLEGWEFQDVGNTHEPGCPYRSRRGYCFDCGRYHDWRPVEGTSSSDDQIFRWDSEVLRSDVAEHGSDGAETQHVGFSQTVVDRIAMGQDENPYSLG